MASTSTKPVLGIVGGLGPYSHVEFERRLLELALAGGHVAREQDFPEWILSSIPATPDRTESIRDDAEGPLPALLASVRRIEQADLGVVVCNTAHHFLPRLRELTALPLLDLVDETADFLAAEHAGRRVGVLGTTGTLASRLYHEPLARRGLRPVGLFDLADGAALQEELVMRAVYGEGGVKLGGDPMAVAPALRRAAETLVERLGAEVLLLACTEISMVLRETELSGRPVVDSLAVLARRAVERIYSPPPAD